MPKHVARGGMPAIDRGLTTERIEALTDGIFAFAMTLLVLNLKLPIGVPSPQLPAAVAAMWPSALTFIISFATLGVFRVALNAQFYWIKHSTRRSLWLNLLLLGFVVIVPFTTTLLAGYTSSQFAVVLYASNMVACWALLYVIWMYAFTHPELTHGELKKEVLNVGNQRMLGGLLASVLAIVISFVSVQLSILILLLTPVALILVTTADRVLYDWENKA